jgi:hypothetical protein
MARYGTQQERVFKKPALTREGQGDPAAGSAAGEGSLPWGRGRTIAQAGRRRPGAPSEGATAWHMDTSDPRHRQNLLPVSGEAVSRCERNACEARRPFGHRRARSQRALGPGRAAGRLQKGKAPPNKARHIRSPDNLMPDGIDGAFAPRAGGNSGKRNGRRLFQNSGWNRRSCRPAVLLGPDYTHSAGGHARGKWRR